MADYRLLPHSEEDESEGEMGDIDEDENIDYMQRNSLIVDSPSDAWVFTRIT